MTQPGKLTFADLCELIRSDYDVHRRRSRQALDTPLKRLAEYFGHRMPATITWSDGQAYRAWGREEPRAWSESTINKHLAALKHALRLAVKDGKLAAAPLFELPNRRTREGFFEREDFDAMLEHLPEAYRPVAVFACCTGWRTRSEVLPLRWNVNVDRQAGLVRLAPNTTKNTEGRTFPFDALPELALGHHGAAREGERPVRLSRGREAHPLRDVPRRVAARVRCSGVSGPHPA